MATHIGLLLAGAERGGYGTSDRMCYAVSGEPVADLNLAALWGAASDDDVDRLLDGLDDLDAMIVVSEGGKERLRPALQLAGLTAGGPCPLMARDLGREVMDESGPYHVEAVRRPDELEAMVGALADAYAFGHGHVRAAFGPRLLDEPDVTPFVAWRDGRAHSALVATKVGADIGIWSVGTPTGFQRRGGGRALLAAVMSRFAEEDATRCFLFPSPAGRRLYDSLGFAEADLSEIWLKGRSTEFPESTP